MNQSISILSYNYIYLGHRSVSCFILYDFIYNYQTDQGDETEGLEWRG